MGRNFRRKKFNEIEKFEKCLVQKTLLKGILELITRNC